MQYENVPPSWSEIQIVSGELPNDLRQLLEHANEIVSAYQELRAPVEPLTKATEDVWPIYGEVETVRKLIRLLGELCGCGGSLGGRWLSDVHRSELNKARAAFSVGDASGFLIHNMSSTNELDSTAHELVDSLGWKVCNFASAIYEYYSGTWDREDEKSQIDVMSEIDEEKLLVFHGCLLTAPSLKEEESLRRELALEVSAVAERRKAAYLSLETSAPSGYRPRTSAVDISLVDLSQTKLLIVKTLCTLGATTEKRKVSGNDVATQLGSTADARLRSELSDLRQLGVIDGQKGQHGYWLTAKGLRYV